MEKKEKSTRSVYSCRNIITYYRFAVNRFTLKNGGKRLKRHAPKVRGASEKETEIPKDVSALLGTLHYNWQKDSASGSWLWRIFATTIHRHATIGADRRYVVRRVRDIATRHAGGVDDRLPLGAAIDSHVDVQ